jgi:hypothetical protein
VHRKATKAFDEELAKLGWEGMNKEGHYTIK